jgi:hypothetical protein
VSDSKDDLEGLAEVPALRRIGVFWYKETPLAISILFPPGPDVGFPIVLWAGDVQEVVFQTVADKGDDNKGKKNYYE